MRAFCTGCIFALTLVACTPSDVEQRYERMQMEYKPQDNSRDAKSLSDVIDGVKDEEVIALVKGSQSPDESVVTDTWVEQQVYKDPGQVMFRRWAVQRKTSSKYEVRFTYTLVSSDYRSLRKGWLWIVDAVLKVVGPPKPLADERQAGLRPVSGEDDKKRIRDAEAVLE